MDPETLDMSVLGRDILDLFTLLVERRSGTVLLLREPHRWRVEAG
jgi:hypothetical protein